MISGEPRTASIVAREPCLVWVIAKRDVVAYNGGVLDDQLNAAHATLLELRQANIFNVYKPLLEPPFLSSFPLLHGLQPDTLGNLVKHNSSPTILRSGTRLFSPTTSMSQRTTLLVLRGRLSVSVQSSLLRRAAIVEQEADATTRSLGSSGRVSPAGYSLSEMLRHLFDVPKRRVSFSGVSSLTRSVMHPHPAILIESRLTQLLPSCDDKDVVHVAKIDAPALLNLAFCALGYSVPPPFTVDAITDCDVLTISRETMRHQDVLELAVIKQNALNLQCELAPSISRASLVQWITHGISTHDNTRGVALDNVLQTLRSATDAANTFLKEERWVYAAQDFMCFEPQSAFLINIVLDGELELSNSQPTLKPPLVWPPIAQSFFASSNMTIRVKSRANVLRIRRQDLIAWMCRSLRTPELRTLVSQLASQVISTSSKVPTFSQFGLDDRQMHFSDSMPLQKNTPGTGSYCSGSSISSMLHMSDISLSTLSEPSSSSLLCVILPIVDRCLYGDLDKNEKDCPPPSSPPTSRYWRLKRPSTFPTKPADHRDGGRSVLPEFQCQSVVQASTTAERPHTKEQLAKSPSVSQSNTTLNSCSPKALLQQRRAQSRRANEGISSPQSKHQRLTHTNGEHPVSAERISDLLQMMQHRTQPQHGAGDGRLRTAEPQRRLRGGTAEDHCVRRYMPVHHPPPKKPQILTPHG